MRLRRLGRTALQVSELGLGGYSFRDTAGREAHIALIRKAVEAGVNLIDTAPGYQDSEETVGAALEGLPRDRLLLSTKYYPYGDGDRINPDPRQLVESVERSLKRLKTDRLDLLHLHWIHSAEDMQRILAAPLANGLRKLQAEGKVRFLAVSEASELDGTHSMLEWVIPTRFFDSVMVTYNLLLQTAEQGVLPLARQTDTGVIVMMPLNQPAGGSGLANRECALENLRRLRAEGALPEEAPYTDPGVLDFLTAGTNLTVPQAALRFVLDHPDVHCVLVGTTNPAHLDEAVAAATSPALSRETHAAARKLFGKIAKQVK